MVVIDLSAGLNVEKKASGNKVEKKAGGNKVACFICGEMETIARM